MGPSTGALAWPWWGRSLPKGNQWECWDSGLGPNVVRLPVHLPPLHPLIATNAPNTPITSTPPRSSPMPPDGTYIPTHLWVLTLPTIPNAPLTPLHPLMAPMPPDGPLTPPDTLYTPRSPQCPSCHLYPCWSLSTYTPCQPPMHPWHPYTPWWNPDTPGSPLMPLTDFQCLWHSHTFRSLPMPPYAICTPVDPWAPTLPASAPMHPWHPLHTWQISQQPLILPTPLGASNAPWCHLYPCWPLNTYTPCQPQCTPDTPHPWHPYTLLVEASSGQQWYYCRSAWHPPENFYIQKTFYPQE